MAHKKRKRLILPPPCENCGYRVHIRRGEHVEVPAQHTNTYAIVVACATCGAPFSLISRN